MCDEQPEDVDSILQVKKEHVTKVTLHLQKQF